MQRILSIQNTKSLGGTDKVYQKKAKSFQTINTGLYDLPKLFELQKEDYIQFVMNLFEVTPKNKTTGSLIEFVSGHDQTTFLRSISKITGNKNLLLLEQHYGEVKRPYTSFYVPKDRQEKSGLAKLNVSGRVCSPAA